MGQVICRYRKGEEVRWLSHLDLKRTLERAMRRAQLPLALTQGHNPRPKLSLGPPLPLGATGDGELLVIHLSEAVGAGEVKERLNRQFPRGLEVLEAWTLPGYRRKETFGEIDVAEYRVTVCGEATADEMRQRVTELLARDQLVVERGGERPERTVNLRPLILSLTVVRAGEGEIELQMRLRTGSHGGARPQEVIALLGMEEAGGMVRYHRVGLYAATEAPNAGRKGMWRRWGRPRGKREKTGRQ